MFNKLIASAPEGRRLLRNPVVIIVSVGLHVLLLGGIVWASSAPEEEPAPEPERVTYIDVTEIPPPEPDPEEVFEAAPEDAAPAVQQPTPTRAAPPPTRAPATPRNPQPAAQPSDEPAGFQELRPPDLDVSGIPLPQVDAPAVRAEDFGGRGVAGGTASGTPAPAPPASSRTGTGTGTGGTGGGGGGEGGTFSANLVDEPVQLTNGQEVARVLSRRYPSQLRDSGIEGRVVVQFVVDRNGRVEPGTIKIISSSHDGFSDPSRAAVTEFRFRPAKRNGQNVRQIVQLPVTWQVDR